MPDLWTPDQLDAIERRYPTREVRSLVAEIRRLNTIAVCAGDLVRALRGSEADDYAEAHAPGARGAAGGARDGAEEG